jgi:hypothetical protein
MKAGPTDVRRPASAFISYARADGEEVASALRERIMREQPGISLWQDRAQLYGGVGWWQQIEQALRQVSFLIIVMTPAALRSETTRKEWQYARQQGVCVFPVKGGPDAGMDWAVMPKWMSTSHFYDLATEWDTFILHLKSPCAQSRVPFMAPDLPGHFVWRAAEFDVLLGGPHRRDYLDSGRGRIRQDDSREGALPRRSSGHGVRRWDPVGHSRRDAGSTP